MVDGTLALSIPGLFLTCVQYFELLQLGRNFKTDFASSLLQLRAAELRLQRWGNAAGITDEASNGFVSNLQKNHTEQEVKFAHYACLQIRKQLSRAQEDFQDLVDINKGEEELVDEFQQLEICGPPVARATRVLNNIKSRYDSSLQFTKKASSRGKWALYKKNQLGDLLSVITEHVATLETLFPEQEKALVVAEAKEMEPEVIKTLAPAVDKDDPLAEALKVEGGRKGMRYEDIDVSGNAAPHLGSNYRKEPQNEGQTVWKNLKFSGNSSGQAGNNYGFDNPAQRYSPAGHLG